MGPAPGRDRGDRGAPRARRAALARGASAGLTASEEVVLAGRSVTILRPAAVEAQRDAGADRQGAELYWAGAWPSGRALAAVVGELELEGVRVLELGCGLGLPSLAAALRGAEVVATDLEPAALALLRRNARRVRRRVATLVVDLEQPPPARLAEAGPFPLVLAADVLYRPSLVSGLARLLPALLAPGGRALVAYPWRDQGLALEAALGSALHVARAPLAGSGGPGGDVHLATLRRPGDVGRGA